MFCRTMSFVILGALLGIGACSDERVTNVETPGGAMLQAVSGDMISTDLMQSDLEQITREVALALADPAVRRVVFDALQGSKFPEHKLHFGTFLRENGAALRSAMASARGQGAGAVDVLATLDRIVDLEFYMPVQEHFDRWRGGSDLIVASVLADDGTVPTAFDLTGRSVPLRSAEVPPEVPTLGLVSVETDFTEPGGVPTPAAVMSSSNAIYMTQTSGLDESEGFLFGDPEFEVHVFVKQAGGTFTDQQCAGNSQDVPFQYNQDEPYWSGSVQLIGEAALSTQPFDIEIWEDDDQTPCRSGSSDNGRPPSADALTKSNFQIWGPRAILQVDGSGTIAAPFMIVTALLGNPPQYSNPDDDIGVIVGGPVGGCWWASGPQKFELRKAGSGHPSAGFAWLDFRFGIRSPLCTSFPVTITGPTEMDAGALCDWSASINGGVSPYTYIWKIGTQTVSTSSGYTGSQTSSFTLSLTVTDANSLTGNDLHSVTVNAGGFGLTCG